MPLPLILGGLALAAGAFGVKKGVDAYSDNKEADSLRQKAAKKFEKAKTKLEQARDECNSDLESLGELRLKLVQSQIGRFASLFRQFRNRDVLVSGLEEFEAVSFSREELKEMVAQSSAAGKVLAAGVSTLGSGVLAGMGSYGAATMLASASTGTAISTLSGVAATNATLAWFGGGSLAAGGLGIAGGAAVLGGIVAAPVLAVGGMVLAAKARENLANARKSLAEAEKAASEMKAARAVVETIIVGVGQFREVLTRLDDRFTPVLDDLEAVIENERRRCWWIPWKFQIDVRKLADADQRLVHYACLLAQAFRSVLDAHVLTEEGAFSEASGQVLADGMELIRHDKEVAGRIGGSRAIVGAA